MRSESEKPLLAAACAAKNRDDLGMTNRTHHFSSPSSTQHSALKEHFCNAVAVCLYSLAVEDVHLIFFYLYVRAQTLISMFREL